ncbi:HAD family acid phosphatase [Nocardia salmonicida]|uniref:phosphatase domain-containing protein n=1 Tax=Nocardia salmonicida TaxID=53431 RepID=UPI0036B9D05C
MNDQRSIRIRRGQRPQAVVIDIDGTVSDCGGRMALLTGKEPNWESFFAMSGSDRPLREGLELAFSASRDHRILWLTGRPERFRGITMAWLSGHGLPVDMLYMREDHDRRPVAEYKSVRMLDIADYYDVRLVVDDDVSVVQALQTAGWPVQHASWASR